MPTLATLRSGVAAPVSRAGRADERAVPSGFQPLVHRSRFLASLGPLFVKREREEVTLGVHIREEHLNSSETPHGGMMLTLADTAMWLAIKARSPRLSAVTVQLSAEFLGSSRRGDWVEVPVELLRVGRRLAFASCRVVTRGRCLLRASGVFSLAKAAARAGKAGR